MIKNIFVLIALIILISCDNQKIGVEVVDKDNLNKDNLNVVDDKVIDDKKPVNDDAITNNKGSESDQDKVTRYIKNNFIKINPTRNNYDNLLNIAFEGVNNVNIEFTENNQHYKLILEYKIDDFNSSVELTRLGYYINEDQKWKRITAIPESKNLTQDIDGSMNDQNNNKVDVVNNITTGNTIGIENNTGSTNDKKRIQDIVLGSGADKSIINVKDFDVLNIAKLSLTISYPKYWYWRWISTNDAIATIIFSKNQVENIEEATVVLKIKKNTTDASMTTSDMVILTKDRDNNTIFELTGPSSMKDTLQTMLNSATKFDAAQLPKYNSDSWKTIIPESCIKFFDGCNDCKKIDNNISCTKRGCIDYQQPKCLD